MEIKFNEVKKELSVCKNKIAQKFKKIAETGIFFHGKENAEMIENLKKITGYKYILPVKNGTDALYIAIKYFSRGYKNIPIIIPSFGAFPTAVVAAHSSQNIHYVDVSAQSGYCIDPKCLPPAIKNGIIIPVHLFGNACDIKAIAEYAKSNNHVIIEDCAQATGNSLIGIKQLPCVASTYSFYPTKPLACAGDGGAIGTDNIMFYEWAKIYTFYGLTPAFAQTKEKLSCFYRNPGINSRMDEWQCAIVNAKANKFMFWNKTRKKIAKIYDNEFSNTGIKTIDPQFDHVYHQYVILHEKISSIETALKKSNIPFAYHYPRMLPELRGIMVERKKDISKKIISIPIHQFLSESQIDKVIKTIKKAIK